VCSSDLNFVDNNLTDSMVNIKNTEEAIKELEKLWNNRYEGVIELSKIKYYRRINVYN
jgi:hypothetical protein